LGVIAFKLHIEFIMLFCKFTMRLAGRQGIVYSHKNYTLWKFLYRDFC